MKIAYSAFTSTGLVRNNNQDNLLCVQSGNYGLFVVADGMGGHFGGEIASGRLVAALNNWWTGFIDNPIGFEECAEVLKKAITAVNDNIYNEFSKFGRICGTTVALLLLYNDKYLLINAGDSRIYSKRRHKTVQESIDHVFSVEAKISGMLTDTEIQNHKNKNKLTSAVGCKEKFKMSIKTAPLTECSFFMCTDGVYKFCNEKDIQKFLCARESAKLEQSVKKIVESNGANDNFSYIKIRCSEEISEFKKYLLYAAAAFVLIICVAAVITRLYSLNSDDRPPLDESESIVLSTTGSPHTNETSEFTQAAENVMDNFNTKTNTQYTTTVAPAYTDDDIEIYDTIYEIEKETSEKEEKIENIEDEADEVTITENDESTYLEAQNTDSYNDQINNLTATDTDTNLDVSLSEATVVTNDSSITAEEIFENNKSSSKTEDCND